MAMEGSTRVAFTNNVFIVNRLPTRFNVAPWRSAGGRLFSRFFVSADYKPIEQSDYS
jgi:hypothetical protein